MEIDRLVSQMKHADIWFKNEFAQLLATYNKDKGNELFFMDLIYKAVCASKLKPIDGFFDLSTPFESRNFSFSPSDLIDWATSKKFLLPKEIIEIAPQNISEEVINTDDYTINEELDLTKSPHWIDFKNKVHIAISQYPTWKKSLTRKFNKTNALTDWVQETTKANTREAELIKKILSDFYKELQ
jgi:hypothetical protein